MQIIDTKLDGVKVIEIKAYKDSRGFFAETWRAEWSTALGLDGPMIQDNHAYSAEKGVVRGLHFQAPPHAQSKLIWAVRGAVFDVAVDIRKGSPTYGQWHAEILSAENMRRMFVPAGFAHGYMTLEAHAEVLYKVDSYYAPAAEGGVLWNDPGIGVAWPEAQAILNGKDLELPLLSALDSPFTYRNKQ